ncbi:MAG: phage minor head protein, partial [Rhodospirillales bacterium]
MTGKYNPFYRTKPKLIYIPDHWGRLDQGKWVENDNFSAPPKRESGEYLDARNLFHVTTSIGDRGTNNRTDVGKLEALMYMAGVYDLDNTGGPTGYYGERLKLAVRDFQKSHALTVDGNVNPDGETVRTLAQYLQDMGRRGGTVLAHLTPGEARFLHENTDGGSINPQTGLMEFYEAGKKDGLTVDGNVNPDGETVRALAQNLQDMGRRGDTVLAHLTPREARFLHDNTDGGSINPHTGLMEFYEAGKKEGSYIWRTVGDSKVRSSHAERDGKVFSWDDPPEGGHPGEAPNCRCR